MKLLFRNKAAGIFIALVLSISGLQSAKAESCPNAHIFGATLIDFPWSEVFPAHFGGATFPGKGWTPAGDYRAPVCVCYDRFGVPEFGITTGFWAPTILTEVTSKKWCSSVAGGTMIGPSYLPFSDAGDIQHPDHHMGHFYHYVQWAFPILEMMDLLTQVRCNNGLDYTDLDVITPSYVLPTWNDEPLAYYTNPLSILFANVASVGIGIAECMALTAGAKPFNSWPGVAGCWGNIYPLSGNLDKSSSPQTAQSLVATRAMAFSVGLGMERYTVGAKAMCKPEWNPNLIKDRFKLSLLYPKVESGSHPIGKPTLLWGEWLNKYTGPDTYVNLVFKYTQCCIR